MLSDIALAVFILGAYGLFGYVMRQDYKNEQDFRRFHNRE